MPRTRSLAWAQLKIGILAVFAIVMAAAFTFVVGGQGGFFWQRYELRTQFPDVRGLKTGAVVRVAGVEVGKVTGVHFRNAQVEVVLELSRDMQPRVTTESRAAIGALSLLGDPIIDISASDVGDPLPDGGFIESGPGAGQVADVALAASRGLDEATRLLQDVRQGRGTVGRLFTDEALYQEIQTLVDATAEVAQDLNRGTGTVGRLLKDPAAYESLQASLTNLSTITERISAGEGSLGRLLNDDELAQSLSAASGSIAAITGRLERGEGTAGRLLADDQLYQRLDTMTARLDQITGRLSAGEGTAGQLLQDQRLYENMNQAVAELRSLVSDIRQDPRKFLNVRVSVF
jgi:phospholipid/cholesterol/gamma-HCH transport system substrate-binding protein